MAKFVIVKNGMLAQILASGKFKFIRKATAADRKTYPKHRSTGTTRRKTARRKIPRRSIMGDTGNISITGLAGAISDILSGAVQSCFKVDTGGKPQQVCITKKTSTTRAKRKASPKKRTVRRKKTARR